MLDNVVLNADVDVEIHLDNKVSFTVPLKDSDDVSETYIQQIKINRTLNTQGESLAVISSDSLSLDIISMDQKLNPDNENSTYYGHMNDQAIIKLFLRGYQYENEDGQILYKEFEDKQLGEFYVTDWSNSVTTEEPNGVTISAQDILSDMLNTVVPSIEFSPTMTMKEYVIAVIDKINNSITDTDYKLKYNAADISFGEFDTKEVNLYLLDTTTLGNLLNHCAQSTLTNIFINNDGYLETNQLYTATEADICSVLTEEKNIVSISVGDGALVPYNAIEVKYPTGALRDIAEIANATEQEDGDIELQYNTNAYRVHALSVKCDTSEPTVVIKETTPSHITLSLSGPEKADVSTYGRTASDTLMRHIKTLTNRNKISTLSIVNRIISNTDISKYCNYIATIMELQKNQISVNGYFNPLLCVSADVSLIAQELLGLQGTYKITGISLCFGEDFSCDLTLLKYVGDNNE